MALAALSRSRRPAECTVQLYSCTVQLYSSLSAASDCLQLAGQCQDGDSVSVMADSAGLDTGVHTQSYNNTDQLCGLSTDTQAEGHPSAAHHSPPVCFH